MLVNQKLQIYSANDVIRIIKHFPLRNDNNTNLSKVPFEYQNKDSNECIILRDKWNIPEEFALGEKAVSSIIRLLSWYKDHFRFNKNQSSSSGIEALIESSSYKLIYEKLKNEEISFTPFFVALFFLYTLLSVGYKARLAICTPLMVYEKGKYFVEAFVEDYNVWIAIDINNYAIYCDDSGKPLSIVKIREHLSDNNHLIVYSSNERIYNSIFDELVKNIFSIIFIVNNKIDMLNEKTITYYYLTPTEFKGENKIICNKIENKKYRIVFDDNAFDYY